MISIKKDFKDIPRILLTKKTNAFSDKSVKEKLIEIYKGKCAYCEQKTETFYVEHYRPKSQYPWLINEWSNILPVCPECDKAKKDNFPVNGKQIKEKPIDKKEYSANSETLIAELPVVIHPEIDTPENHFYYDKSGIAYGNTNRGQKNITILNLNREYLIQKRKALIDSVNNKINSVEINNLPEEQVVSLIMEVFTNLYEIAENEDDEFTLLRKQIVNHFTEFYFDSTDDKRNELLINIYKKYLLVKHNIKNIQSKIKLPLAIHGFRIRNFQGIKDLQIYNIPLTSNFIFLTGENASGKTSVLRALLIGFVGDKELKQNEISEDARIELIYKKGKELIISEFRGNYHSLEKNIAGYGATRIFLSDLKEKLPITYSLFEKGTNLMNIEDKLIELDGNTKSEKLKKLIIELLKKTIPTLYNIEIEVSDTGKKVIYYEKNDMNKIPKKVSFYQLASGMRSIIGVIGDMLLRFMENQPTIQDFKNFTGIVFIDEIENHLHPKWQRNFISTLSKNFKKIQFFIATHSPITFLGAPKNSYYLKLERDNLEQISFKNLNQLNPSNLLPNTILTSPYFNFDKLIPESNENLMELRTEDTYSEILENDKIQKRLDEIEKDNDNYPDELFKIK